MNLFRLIGELVVIYFLYKLIFDFIIPLYKSSKQMRGKIHEMHTKMREQQQTQQQKEKQEPPKKQTIISKDDYLDYEEIK